jgi:hypothetical protein
LDYLLKILGIIFELKFSSGTQMPLSPELEAYQVNPPVSSPKKSVIEIVSDPLSPDHVKSSESPEVDSIKMSKYQGKMLFHYRTGQFLTNRDFTKIKLWSPYEAAISEQRCGRINFNGVPTLQLILWGRASLDRYCFMHGALVVIEDKYVLLMGDSGTGKTTFSKLAVEMGYTNLTDENPYLQLSQEDIYVHATPWPGSLGPPKPRKGPLAAVCVVRHLSKNEIKRLSLKQASRSLIHNSRTFNWLPETIPTAINILDHTVHKVPVYDFGFLPSKSAVETLRERL